MNEFEGGSYRGGTASRSKYTIWHWLGCGCAVLILLGVIGMGGLTFFGWRMAQSVMDPEQREANVQGLLGYDELPEGYYPGIGISIPFVMDMAIIGDREIPDGPRTSIEDDDVIGDAGFVFFRMRQLGGADLEEETEYDFDADRTLREGSLDAAGAEIDYRMQVGWMRGSRRSGRAVAAELRIDCGDGYSRSGAWFVRLPEDDAGAAADAAEAVESAEAPSEDVAAEVAPEPEVEREDVEAGEITDADLVGTPADEDALRDFLDHFDLCRG